jgi:GT2 family glycosyltransferase
MPRATLDRVGLFDENIFYSPEDVDYCIRVWGSGLRVKCDSGVTVVHDAQEISRRLIPRRASFSHAWGLVYLFRTHGFCLSLTRLHRRIGRWRAPEVASGGGRLAGRLAS